MSSDAALIPAAPKGNGRCFLEMSENMRDKSSAPSANHTHQSSNAHHVMFVPSAAHFWGCGQRRYWGVGAGPAESRRSQNTVQGMMIAKSHPLTNRALSAWVSTPDVTELP